MARSTKTRRSGAGATGTLALLLLVGALAAGAWFAYQRTAENRRIRESNERVLAEQAALAELDELPPEATLDPFSEIDLGHVRNRSARGTRSGIESATFSEQARLCGDSRWADAVDMARRAFDLLREADVLHAESGLAWRKPALEGFKLLQRAHETTADVEAELDSGAIRGSLNGVRSVRQSWAEKNRDLNKVL